MEGRPDLIQPRHHLVLRQRLEARRLEIEALGNETGADMLGHELLVERRFDGEFCVH